MCVWIQGDYMWKRAKTWFRHLHTTATSSTKNTLKQYEVRLCIFVVYTISQIACIEREWSPFMQWHRIWLTPSYIEYIALTTAVPFNTGHPSAVSRSRQLKSALHVFSHYKVPLTFRYSWKRLRKRRSKNLIKFPQVYIAFVLQYVHCFEKNTTYWLNESWETRLPKRLKCTIVWFVYYIFCPDVSCIFLTD